MASAKFDIHSLAASIRPGIYALVAKEIQHIIDEAVVEMREKLVKRISHVVEVRVQEVMYEDRTNVKVDCRVNVNDGTDYS